MTTTLDASAFLASFGVTGEVKPGEKPGPIAKIPQPKGGVSREFRRLIVNYAATCLQAYELESVKWEPLASKLGTQTEFVAEAARVGNEDGSLWGEVMEERIRRAGASKVFRDADWEKLEAQTVAKLLDLAERNLIRDVGELLAIARAARQASEVRSPTPPTGGQNVNINFNGGNPMTDELPASGAKMTIDLSPRSAQSLAAQRGEKAEARVIDSSMISAVELRELLSGPKVEPLPETELTDSGE